MRLTLTRYGGIAGKPRPPIVIDTSTIRADDAERLVELVRAANLKPGNTELAHDPKARDAFGYELEVTDDDGQKRSIAFDHRSAPEPIRAMVDAIRRVAMTPPPERG